MARTTIDLTSRWHSLVVKVSSLLTTILGYVLAFALIGFVALLFHWYRRWRWNPLKEGLETFEPDEYDPERLNGQWNGYSAEIYYGQGGRYERDWLTLLLNDSELSFPVVSFREESWYHWLSKKLGLTEELQTGAYDFDRNVYVVTENHRTVQPWLSDPVVRELIEALLEPPRSSLHLGRDGIKLKVKSSFGWGTYFKPDWIRNRFDRLVALSETNVPEAPERPPVDEAEIETMTETLETYNSLSKWILIAGLSTLFVGPLTWFLGSYYPPINSELHRLALKSSGIVLALYLVFAYYHVRGHSQSHRQFTTYLVCLTIGLPTLFIGVLELANGVGHSTDERWVPGRVQTVRYDDGNYDIEVQIETESHTGEITLPYHGDRERLNGHRPVNVLVSGGRLGAPWYRAYRLPVDNRNP